MRNFNYWTQWGVMILVATLGMVQISRAQENTICHTVQRGDNLSKIAVTYGVTVDAITKANALTTTIIHPGQVLCFPTTVASAPIMVTSSPISSGSSYTVQKGDSLALVAKKFGVTIVDLQKWNGLKGTIIYRGQVLIVSASITSTAIPPTAVPPTTTPTTPQPTAMPPTAIPTNSGISQANVVPAKTLSPYDSNGDGRVTCADGNSQAALEAGYTNLDHNNNGIPCEEPKR